MLSNPLVCPACKNSGLTAKYEATYVYSYTIGSHDPALGSREELLPFLFDNRSQKDSRQYLECTSCGAQYPCSFNEENKGIDFTILQKAIRSDHTIKPEFLG